MTRLYSTRRNDRRAKSVADTESFSQICEFVDGERDDYRPNPVVSRWHLLSRCLRRAYTQAKSCCVRRQEFQGISVAFRDTVPNLDPTGFKATWVSALRSGIDGVANQGSTS